MDVRALRYFAKVAELGSFSAAARHLNVAQPALSRQVKELEAELAAKLLTRSPRGIATTDAGERLFHYALGILHQLEQLPSVVRAAGQPISGVVTIGLPTSTGAVLSTPLLQRAKERYPGIRLHLIESLTGFLEEWVMAGRLDLAVLYNAEPSSKLQITGLLLEDLFLICSPSTLPLSRRTISFAELAHYPLVVPGLPHALRRLIDSMARSHGIELDIAYEVDSLPVLKNLVQSGSACAILSGGAVSGEISDGTLRATKIVRPHITRSVSLAASAVLGATPARAEISALIVELTADLQKSGIWRGTVHPPP